MPRSNSAGSAAIRGTGPPLTRPPPPPSSSSAFGFNPKLEYDDQDDALGEIDSYTLEARGRGVSPTKAESELEPSSGTGAKRKRPLKLTTSQRERKRAIDREAQRSIRIKTKNYIAHLENLVKVMEQSDTTGPDGENNRTRELMNQLKQSQDEVRSLREAMLCVQRTLSTVLGGSSVLSVDMAQQSSHSDSPASIIEPLSSTTYAGNRQFPPPTSASQVAPPPRPRGRQASTNSLAHVPSQSDQPPPPQSAPIPERPKSAPRRPRVEGELFFYAEYHLNRVYAAGPAAFGNTVLDEDIPVRAVIEGWASVEEHHDLDLAWQVIREIDQTVWSNVGIVERMAIIRFVRTKLLHQINARAARPLPIVPDYITQEVAEHPHHADIIDHFIWPGFRHVLVEQPQKYISNHFTDKFRFNLKFLWPFGIDSAYTKDPITETYSSTQEFVNRQWDLRCWTMRRRFFAGSEELFSSIPTFDVPIHKPLSLGSPNGVGMVAMGAHEGHHGMVEEQEVGDSQGLDEGVGGVVNDPTALNVNGGSSIGVDGGNVTGEMGGGWHSLSPSHNLAQFWNLSPVNGMGDSYSTMGSHAGTGYSMQGH